MDVTCGTVHVTVRFIQHKLLPIQILSPISVQPLATSSYLLLSFLWPLQISINEGINQCLLRTPKCSNLTQVPPPILSIYHLLKRSQCCPSMSQRAWHIQFNQVLSSQFPPHAIMTTTAPHTI